MEEMYIQANNIELFCKKTGHGFPLLMLHGNGEDHQIFNALSLKLKNNFSIYQIDSRNHGKSSKTKSFSYEIMMEDIHSFIKEIGFKNVNILGFSDGAIISILLSLKYPELVNKQALLGVNLSPLNFKKSYYNSMVEEYEKNMDPLLEMMLKEPNISLCEVSKIKHPTLIIKGEKDIFQENIFEEIRRVVKNSALMTIKDHNHDSYILNNDMLAQSLYDFYIKKES